MGPNPSSTALEEWHAQLRALETGQTALIVRQGSIRNLSLEGMTPVLENPAIETPLGRMGFTKIRPRRSCMHSRRPSRT